MIPRLQPGQEPTAALLNSIIDGVNAAQITSADFPLERTTAGTRLSLPKTQPEFYAIITESPERYRVNGGEVVDGEYEWAQVVLGQDGFEELDPPEDGLASHYDPYPLQALYNPAYELNDNRRIEAGRIVRMKPYAPIHEPNPPEGRGRGFLRRYVFSVESPPTTYWFKAQKNWSFPSGYVNHPHPYVWAVPCDIRGEVQPGAQEIELLLPVAGKGEARYGMVPNVVAGDILAGARMEEDLESVPTSKWVCVSDYLDEDFKTTIWFAGTEAEIRPGWKLCSAENSGYGVPDLSGRFILGLDPLNAAGDNSEDTLGDTGGFRDHGAGTNTHTDHADHLLALDDGCFISALGGESGGRIGTTCPGLNGPGFGGKGQTDFDVPPTHQHDLTMTWFFKVGFDWTVHPGLLITLTHSIHSLTDNRPRFYVLAAKMRINNSE